MIFSLHIKNIWVINISNNIKKGTEFLDMLHKQQIKVICFMDEDDIRIKRTRASLFKALIDLLNAKDISSITIKEICNVAMVNRTTFYRHYENKMDLLERGISQFIDSIIENITPASVSEDPIRVRLVSLFLNLSKKSSLLKRLLGPNIPMTVFYHMQVQIEKYMLKERILPISKGTFSTNKAAMFSSMTTSVLIGIIRYWLTEAPESDPLDLAKFYYDYILSAFDKVMIESG